MAKQITREVAKDELPPLCAAVRKLRKTSGDTLEAFASRVGISINSASRFELGKAVPIDIGVLWKLEAAANELGLPEEGKLFAAVTRAEQESRWKPLPAHMAGPVTRISSFNLEAHSMSMWRLMEAARIAFTHFPECIEAVEEALAPCLEVIDEVLKNAEHLDYRELQSEVNHLANKRQLLNIIGKRKNEPCGQDTQAARQ